MKYAIKKFLIIISILSSSTLLISSPKNTLNETQLENFIEELLLSKEFHCWEKSLKFHELSKALEKNVCTSSSSDQESKKALLEKIELLKSFFDENLISKQDYAVAYVLNDTIILWLLFGLPVLYIYFYYLRPYKEIIARLKSNCTIFDSILTNFNILDDQKFEEFFSLLHGLDREDSPVNVTINSQQMRQEAELLVGFARALHENWNGLSRAITVFGFKKNKFGFSPENRQAITKENFQLYKTESSNFLSAVSKTYSDLRTTSLMIICMCLAAHFYVYYSRNEKYKKATVLLKHYFTDEELNHLKEYGYLPSKRQKTSLA